MDRPPTLPTELPEAVAAQIDDARYWLHKDAAAAGVSKKLVDDAIADAVEAYREARVHAFIGVLVERQVRQALGLRSVHLQDAD